MASVLKVDRRLSRAGKTATLRKCDERSASRETRPPALRLVSIYSTFGKLLGRAPLACLYAWPAASFAIAPNGRIIHRPRRPAVPDDEFCFPLEPDQEGGEPR